LRKKWEAKAHTGAARIALEAGVPLVPAGIRGTDGLARLARLRVDYGPPIPLDDLESREPHQATHEATDRLMAAIDRLEHAPGLVRVEGLVAVRRHLQRVPGDEHHVRPLALPEPRQHVGDADDCIPVDRLRQRVIGAVGERVAVDCEQDAQSDASSS